MSLSLLLIALCSSTQASYALFLAHNLRIANGNFSLTSTRPELEATEKGDVYVVWNDKSNIFFSSSGDNGTKFRNPALLSYNNTFSSSPQIAATERGDVYVVWVDKNSTTGDTDIEFRASNDSGKTFGDKKELTDLMGIAPQIAVTEKGKVYAVWNDSRVQFQEILENGTIIG